MSNKPAGSLITHFGSLTDSRVDRSRAHFLIDIVVIAICAPPRRLESFVKSDLSAPKVRRGRQVSREVRYFISSLPSHAQRAFQTVHGHWALRPTCLGSWIVLSRR